MRFSTGKTQVCTRFAELIIVASFDQESFYPAANQLCSPAEMCRPPNPKKWAGLS
jgi:hypothetical protein